MRLALNLFRVDPRRGGAETYVADLCRRLIRTGTRSISSRMIGTPLVFPRKSVAFAYPPAVGRDRRNSGTLPKTPKRSFARPPAPTAQSVLLTPGVMTLSSLKGAFTARVLNATRTVFERVGRVGFISRRSGVIRRLGCIRDRAEAIRPGARRPSRRGERSWCAIIWSGFTACRVRGFGSSPMRSTPSGSSSSIVARSATDFAQDLDLSKDDVVALFVGHNARLKGLGPLLRTLATRKRREPGARPIRLIARPAAESARSKRWRPGDRSRRSVRRLLAGGFPRLPRERFFRLADLLRSLLARRLRGARLRLAGDHDGLERSRRMDHRARRIRRTDARSNRLVGRRARSLERRPDSPRDVGTGYDFGQGAIA